MKFKSLIILFLPLLFVLGSCSKECDAEKQGNIDDAAILKFIASNNIQAQKHSSGVYYQILSSGSGNAVYTANTNISAKYIGRLLDGSVFDNGGGQAISFKLGGVITGWQIGIPLIQKGGRIRLLIPSSMAYGCDGRSSIPKNAVLDFDIELVNVTN